jgi:small subunit ribosomal protein S16
LTYIQLQNIIFLSKLDEVKMVKIRLRRVGARKKPHYRLVVADARSPRDGAFIEIIGHYNPLTDPETVVIAEDKARHWLERGAQPTDTAARLLAKVGIIEESKVRKEKSEAGITVKPKPSKKRVKAGVIKKSETSKKEPEASITEESETRKEESEAGITEEPET